MMNSISHVIDEINRIDPNYKNLLILNQNQTSKVIGVSPSTLEKWRKEGIGIEFKKVGGRILYPKTKIAEFIIDTIKTA